MELKTFCIGNDIIYREIKTDNNIINKFYEIINPDNDVIKAIPDGCIDIQIVWNNGSAEIHICGSFLEGRVSNTGNYERCFGIKFNPGVVPNCIQGNVQAVVGKRQLMNDNELTVEILKYVNKYPTFEELVNYFSNLYSQGDEVTSNQITDYIIEKLQSSNGTINIAQLTERTGYSHCYNNRVFKNTMGMTIKKYENIFKIQKAIDFVRESNSDDIYEVLGYYDQAHFINAFKKFTSITPYNYIKNMQRIKIV